MSYSAVGIPGGGVAPAPQSWWQQFTGALTTKDPSQNASLDCPAGQSRAYVGAPCATSKTETFTDSLTGKVFSTLAARKAFVEERQKAFQAGKASAGKPVEATAPGMSTNTKLLIGGGVAAVLLLVFIAKK